MNNPRAATTPHFVLSVIRWAFSVLVVSSIGCVTHAASIGVNFSGDGGAQDWIMTTADLAGAVPQTNWNQISTVGGGDDANLAKGTSGPLLDNSGVATRVRLSHSGNDSWRTAGPTDTPNARMMKGTLKQSGSEAPMVLSFTNLTSGTYDVYVYGNVDDGPVSLDVSIGNVTNFWWESALYDEGVGFVEATSTDPENRPEGNYVKFTGVTPINGAIDVLAFYQEGGNGLGIAGVQLVTAGNFPAFQTATAIGVQTQLTNATVFAGNPASLFFVATNNADEPITYQWYRAGAPIQGATSTNYSFMPLAADNNAQFFAVATTSIGGLSVTSSIVTLTVKANDRTLVTFSEQQGNDVTADPNPYTADQGLPGGVTITFEGFSNWNGSDDHTPTDDDYLLYGDRYEPGDVSRMIFNMPVEVPGFWVATQGGGQPGVATLVGYLAAVEVFRRVLNNSGFDEVTLGTGKLIDRIEFIDYGDSWIDDVTVVKPVVLTFSDQVGNDVTAEPNVYGEAQGLPAGIIATFQGFANWTGSEDHTSTADNYLLYGSNYDAGGFSSITFNTNVVVPSLWVSTQGGGQSGTATIKGLLKGLEQFTYTITGSGFTEMTNGAGKAIDTLRFIDYGDAWIDDLTILRASVLPPAGPPMITFSDQIDNDVEANPNVYTDTNGLPAGITATFTGFNNWRGSADHTSTGDNYLLYGANYDPGSTSQVTFNRPVEVPSFWVSAQGGGQPGVANIKGILAGAEQFDFTLPAGGWTEVTLGLGKTVDSILFTDYGDSWIDDIVVRELVATTTLNIVRKSLTTAALSWTGSGTLQQSSTLTGEWTNSPNQQNPQDIDISNGTLFFRVAK